LNIKSGRRLLESDRQNLNTRQGIRNKWRQINDRLSQMMRHYRAGACASLRGGSGTSGRLHVEEDMFDVSRFVETYQAL
jgi:hypothetical protein